MSDQWAKHGKAFVTNDEGRGYLYRNINAPSIWKWITYLFEAGTPLEAIEYVLRIGKENRDGC